MRSNRRVYTVKFGLVSDILMMLAVLLLAHAEPGTTIWNTIFPTNMVALHGPNLGRAVLATLARLHISVLHRWCLPLLWMAWTTLVVQLLSKGRT